MMALWEPPKAFYAVHDADQNLSGATTLSFDDVREEDDFISWDTVNDEGTFLCSGTCLVFLDVGFELTGADERQRVRARLQVNGSALITGNVECHTYHRRVSADGTGWNSSSLVSLHRFSKNDVLTAEAAIITASPIGTTTAKSQYCRLGIVTMRSFDEAGNALPFVPPAQMAWAHNNTTTNSLAAFPGTLVDLATEERADENWSFDLSAGNEKLVSQRKQRALVIGDATAREAGTDGRNVAQWIMSVAGATSGFLAASYLRRVSGVSYPHSARVHWIGTLEKDDEVFLSGSATDTGSFDAQTVQHGCRLWAMTLEDLN